MFFIPFLFTKRTRYNTFSKISVYLITYVIPIFLLSFLQTYPTGLNNYKFYVTFVIGFISFVNLYEIGYIWNETETIKKEKDPTIRLSQKQLKFYEKFKYFVYLERVVVSIFLNFLLLLFTDKTSVISFSICEIVMLIIYFIYNLVRGPITQLLYFFLSVSKYLAMTFCFSSQLSVSVIIGGIFVFPLVRTMEYKAHYSMDSNINLWFRKYIIKFDVNKITDFRFYMTGILLIISILLYLLKFVNLIPVICSGYIFLYRKALFIAIKNGAKFKNYLKR